MSSVFPTSMAQSLPFCPRLPRMAMRAGRAGAGHGEATQSLMIGPVQKMVLLRAAKGPGVPVRHWRPERSPRVMVSANAMPAMDGGEHIGCRRREISERHGSFGDAKGPELHGKNHRIRGTMTCLTGCREAVITNVARKRAPADLSCASGRSGTCMVKPRGGNARVNAEVCVEGEGIKPLSAEPACPPRVRPAPSPPPSLYPAA